MCATRGGEGGRRVYSMSNVLLLPPVYGVRDVCKDGARLVVFFFPFSPRPFPRRRPRRRFRRTILGREGESREREGGNRGTV